MHRRFALFTVAAFLLAGFAVYGSSLHNAFLTYDDDLFVLKHPLVTSGTWTDLPQVFAGFDAELYMPLTIASLKLDYAIAGANPSQFHLTSFLLHVLGACLLTWLMLLLFKSRRIAFFLGLVFLLHPLNTEAVAWIAARKDVLSTPFFLGSAITYVYAQDRRSRNLMLLSLALFAVGLTAKYMIVTLPAFLVLVDLLRGTRPDKTMAKRIAPFVGVSILFTLIAVLGKQTGLGASAVDVALLGGKTTLWYLRCFFFPEDLRVLYLQETPIGWTPEFLAPWMVLGILAGICWILRKRASGLALGLGFFFIALIPTFPAAVKYGLYFAADHYAYLPMLGLLTGIGWLMSGAVLRPSKRSLTIIACGLLLIDLGMRAQLQSRTWQDSGTVFARALEYHPCSVVAHNNRATWFAQIGKPDEAKLEYEAAIACEPSSARLHLNEAGFLDTIGDEDAALKEFGNAVTLQPLSAEVHFALGVFFQKHGRDADAKAAFANALKLDPGYVERKMRNWAM